MSRCKVLFLAMSGLVEKTEQFFLSRLGLACMPNLKLKLTKISYTLKNFKEDNEDENVE